MKLEITEGDAEKDRVRNSIEDILSENKLLSMSTVENVDPHINTAFYAFDSEFNLYILTPPETKHGKNLEENSSIAVDIHDSRQNWTDDKQGLQLFGEAEIVDNPSKALELYTERFPGMENVASDLDELEKLDSSFYKITTERIKVFDEPRFGTETWITLKIIRS